MTESYNALDANLVRSVISGAGLGILGKYLIDGVKVFWAPLAQAENTAIDRTRGEEARSEGIVIGWRQAFLPSIGLGFGAFFALLPLILVAVDNSVSTRGRAGVDGSSLALAGAWIAVFSAVTVRSLSLSFDRSVMGRGKAPIPSARYLMRFSHLN